MRNRVLRFDASLIGATVVCCRGVACGCREIVTTFCDTSGRRASSRPSLYSGVRRLVRCSPPTVSNSGCCQPVCCQMASLCSASLDGVLH